jgi:hypothetical protein
MEYLIEDGRVPDQFAYRKSLKVNTSNDRIKLANWEDDRPQHNPIDPNAIPWRVAR